MSRAMRCKRMQTNPRLARARRCRLVVVDVEVSGRFSTKATESADLLWHRSAELIEERGTKDGIKRQKVRGKTSCICHAYLPLHVAP